MVTVQVCPVDPLNEPFRVLPVKVAVQVVPVPAALTTLRPVRLAGTASVKVAFVTALGPLLVTTIWYCTVEPCVTLSAVVWNVPVVPRRCDFTIPRSAAAGVTVMAMVALSQAVVRVASQIRYVTVYVPGTFRSEAASTSCPLALTLRPVSPPLLTMTGRVALVVVAGAPPTVSLPRMLKVVPCPNVTAPVSFTASTTRVTTALVLLAEALSDTVVTLAVLLRVPLADAVPVRVYVRKLPSGVALAVFVSRLSAPVTMLTLLAVKLSVPQVAVPVGAQVRAVTVKLAGRLSVTLAPVTERGPLFHTRIVYVTVPPLPTAPGPLLSIARSAMSSSVVVIWFPGVTESPSVRIGPGPSTYVTVA